jgi:hypothetical protein
VLEARAPATLVPAYRAGVEEWLAAEGDDPSSSAVPAP